MLRVRLLHLIIAPYNSPNLCTRDGVLKGEVILYLGEGKVVGEAETVILTNNLKPSLYFKFQKIHLPFFPMYNTHFFQAK